MRAFVFLACVIAPIGAAQAVILAANPASNNGTGGIFMDVTSISAPLSVFQFDTQFGSAAGSAVSVQVWTRPGTYVGFQASNVGWTLHDTVAATSAGTATNASVVLNSAIAIGASQTVAVYLHSVTVGGGIRYWGTGTVSNTNFSDANMQLFSAHSRTGAVAFAGTLFTPRALTGNVHYNVVPEPATMAALGLGLAAVARRRRRA